MNLKNYTSETPASTSMAKIEKNLVSAGARNIMKTYDDNQSCTAISFQLTVNNKVLGFQLPAKVEAIYQILYAKYTKPTEKSQDICRAQAERYRVKPGVPGRPGAGKPTNPAISKKNLFGQGL